MASGTFSVRVRVGSGTSHTGVWVTTAGFSASDADIVARVLALYPSVTGLAANCGASDGIALPQPNAILHHVGPDEWSVRFAFDEDQIELDGSAGINMSSLPVGFKPLSARIRFDGNVNCYAGIATDCNFYIQTDPVTEVKTYDGITGPTDPLVGFGENRYDYDFTTFPVPTMTDLVNNGTGARLTIGTGVSEASAAIAGVKITGTYTTDLYVWYNAITDEYLVQDTDPGAGYVLVPAVIPRIDSITPDQGTIAGGTAVTIIGGGFLDPTGAGSVEGVLFDGEFFGTSLVVVDQHTITCVTPAHWRGAVPVVVRLATE